MLASLSSSRLDHLSFFSFFFDELLSGDFFLLLSFDLLSFFVEGHALQLSIDFGFDLLFIFNFFNLSVDNVFLISFWLWLWLSHDDLFALIISAAE